MDLDSHNSVETQELAMRFLRVFEESFKLLGRHKPPPGHELFKDLKFNQMRAMQLLYNEPGMPQKELAEKLEVTAAAISTSINQLERMQLVERRRDKVDARLWRLYLSEKGGQLIDQSRTARCNAVATLLEGLPLEEQRMIVEAMERALNMKRDNSSIRT